MTEFVIHAGPHKTGTTYLQQAFSAARQQLAARGIHYPSLWGRDGHHRLFDELNSDPNPRLEAEFAALRAANDKVVLLSAEEFSLLSPISAPHLRRLIGPDTPVTIVFYTRAWVHLLPSQWKEAIKNGETETFPEFLFKRLVNPAAHHYVNFGMKLRVLVKFFGRKAIRIVAYDQVMQARQDLFDHFLESILGLPDVVAPNIQRANVSPGAEEIEVIRALGVLERARRNGPIPTGVAVAIARRYLRHKATFEAPALQRALAGHSSTLTIDETTGALLALHRQLFAEYGQCLVPPHKPELFFHPSKAKIPFIETDYLLMPKVQRELVELHRLICAGIDMGMPGPPEPIAPHPGTSSSAPSAGSPRMALQVLDRTAVEPATAVHDIAFRAGGNSDIFVGGGWSAAERGGRWTAAQICELLLTRPAAPGDYLLTIHARPFVVAGRLSAQRLVVEASGVACGDVALGAPSVVRLTLPWEVLRRSEALALRFRLPDAGRPADFGPGSRDRRLLGVSFERLQLTGPVAPGTTSPIQAAPNSAQALPRAPEARVNPYGELLLQFESLGENCEFGLAQRRCQVEPTGLLRFASAPFKRLLHALQRRFEGLGEPGSLSVEPGPLGREYIVSDRLFGFRYHSWANPAEQAPAEVVDREHRRLPLLASRLINDLTEGAKVFVYHSMSPLSEAQAYALFAAVRAYGDGRLLWMELADARHRAGSVVEIMPGLLKGHMDRFAPGDNAVALSLDCWLQVCGGAIAVG